MRRIFILLLFAFGMSGHAVQAESIRYLLYEDFADHLTAALPDEWVIIDANEDFNTWNPVEWGGVRGGPAVRYLSDSTEAADDWLITPALNLEPGVNYTVSFCARVTDESRPHSLSVSVGSTPGEGAEIVLFSDIAVTTPQAFEASFSVDSADAHHIQFRCVSPADSLALYLSRIIVSQPENDLEATLQLDATPSDPNASTVFNVGEEIRSFLFVRNTGPTALTLNSRMNINDVQNPDSTTAFQIIGPAGEIIPFQGLIREALPFPADFREIENGQIIHKFLDLNEGFYDLSTPGEYSVQAIYKNIHRPPDGEAWRGMLISNPVTFSVELGGAQ